MVSTMAVAAEEAPVNIEFRGVTKTYPRHNGIRTVLENCSVKFLAGENYGILGPNGAGKSTLMRLISGAEPPDSGTIIRNAHVSFPLGFSATFHPDLTGRANARFLARIYGKDAGDIAEFVADFSELSDYFDTPIRSYSSGMMAKFAFGMSLALDFDVYLIDEVTEVGDARFRRKCIAAFEERVLKSDIILVSHNPHTIRAFCTKVAILSDRGIAIQDDARAGLMRYEQSMGAGVGMYD